MGYGVGGSLVVGGCECVVRSAEAEAEAEAEALGLLLTAAEWRPLIAFLGLQFEVEVSTKAQGDDTARVQRPCATSIRHKPGPTAPAVAAAAIGGDLLITRPQTAARPGGRSGGSHLPHHMRRVEGAGSHVWDIPSVQTATFFKTRSSSPAPLLLGQ
jgi:hypothetical protein